LSGSTKNDMRTNPVASATRATSTAPRTGVPPPGQFDPTQAEFEARAKILWGDPPEEVTTYLISHGIGYKEASGMVSAMFQERAATLRGIGIKKIVIGSALLAVPVVAYLIFVRLGEILVETFLFTLIAGACGLWIFIGGWNLLLAPKSRSGDVADQ